MKHKNVKSYKKRKGISGEILHTSTAQTKRGEPKSLKWDLKPVYDLLLLLLLKLELSCCCLI